MNDYRPLGGLFPRPPPEGLPVVLGALCGLAMIITYIDWLIESAAPQTVQP